MHFVPEHFSWPMFSKRSGERIGRSMSTKHVRTTADLVRFDCGLKIECCHCGASRTLTATAAMRGLGGVPLAGCARRFRCLRCGMKQARLTVLPPV